MSGGASRLILDVVIERGNPADSTRVLPMLLRHEEIYGRASRQASFDGEYASKTNLWEAKLLGLEDVASRRNRG